MLQELLHEIRSGGPQDIKSLAIRLHTSSEMVAAMLEHLQRSGYLQSYDDCNSGCQGCALKTGCKVQGLPGPRLWTLVEGR